MYVLSTKYTGFLLATSKVIMKRYIFALCKLYINHACMFHNSGNSTLQNKYDILSSWN